MTLNISISQSDRVLSGYSVCLSLSLSLKCVVVVCKVVEDELNTAPCGYFRNAVQWISSFNGPASQ